MSLVARHLEANGVPTVVLGSAQDIVEYCGVPRFLFSDFPLGNPCGHPWRPDMQRAIVEQSLRLLESAPTARTTVKSSFDWKDDPAWRARYNHIDPAQREALLARGVERRRQRAKPSAS